MRRIALAAGVPLGLLLLVPSAALAADGPPSTTRSRPSNTTWVIVAAVLVMFMQAGLPVPRGRLLACEERRHRGRQDPDQPLDRGHLLLGRRLCLRLRLAACSGYRRDHRQQRLLPATSARATEAGGTSRVHRRRRTPRVEAKFLLPVRLLRRVAGDRLGHDARADQVQRLRDLRDRLLGDHLPDRLALGLRRRLAAERRDPLLPTGMQDFAGSTAVHLIGATGALRGAAAARPAQGQVRPRRQAAGDPRALHAARRPRRDDPVLRLVRLQPGLDARRDRRPPRGGRRRDPARRGRRRDRRASSTSQLS